MPARRLPSRRSVLRQNKKRKLVNNRKSHILLKLIILVLFPMAVIFWIVITTYFWDGVHKLVVAADRGESGIELTIYDPLGSITTVIIPADTEVEVAKNLGTWRLKAVSKLAQKEGAGGRLLTDTLVKHFRFPVYVWENTDGYKSNLGVGDRVRIYIFNMGVKNFKREKIDLAQTKYLRKDLLSDGEEGHVLVGKIPADISAIFTDEKVASSMARTKIIDKTGVFLGEKLGEIIEVVGLKAASINEELKEKIDCEVFGNNKDALAAVKKLFNCQEVEGNSDFDVVITVGEEFQKRF